MRYKRIKHYSLTDEEVALIKWLLAEWPEDATALSLKKKLR